MIDNNRRNIEKAFDSRLPDDFSAHSSEVVDVVLPFASRFFQCQNDMLRIVAKKVGFDLSMITIEFRKDSTGLSDKALYEISSCISRALDSSLRKTDQVFDGLKNNMKFSITLPGTHVDNVNIVIDKIRENLKNVGSKFSEADFLFSYESLHENEMA